MDDGEAANPGRTKAVMATSRAAAHSSSALSSAAVAAVAAACLSNARTDASSKVSSGDLSMALMKAEGEKANLGIFSRVQRSIAQRHDAAVSAVPVPTRGLLLRPCVSSVSSGRGGSGKQTIKIEKLTTFRGRRGRGVAWRFKTQGPLHNSQVGSQDAERQSQVYARDEHCFLARRRTGQH